MSVVPDPVELLRDLIRYDTTNPPGNERACVEHVRELLSDAGVESELYAREDERPNLVARLPGSDGGAPLLLYGHVDVVPTAGQQWTHPPFSAELVDGEIWGRGALDMKSGVAMMVAAFLRAKEEGAVPAGGLVLCVLSDEEAGGDFGARFLAQEHPEALAGVRHALGEVGGFSLHVGGVRAYPIQVAEKQMCQLRATVRGPGGHAARPMRGGAMARLARMLEALDGQRTPIHITDLARQMFEPMAAALPGPQGAGLLALLDPAYGRRSARAARRVGAALRGIAAKHRQRDDRPRRIGGERHPQRDRRRPRRARASGLRPGRHARGGRRDHWRRRRARGDAFRRRAGSAGHGLLRRARRRDPRARPRWRPSADAACPR